MSKNINRNIIQDKENQRFILSLEEGEAYVKYVWQDNKMYLTHAQVPVELRGYGIGETLVKLTFDEIEKQEVKAKSICSFVRRIRNENEKYHKFID